MGNSEFWRAVVFSAVATAGIGCGSTPPSADVFTPAHSTFAAAARDFVGLKAPPHQPIEFPHNTHIAKGVACTEYCHESVTKGPRAGLPSLNTCMICHAGIATDRPLIKQITELSDKGFDLEWERVYGYPNESHVRFNHAPHIGAKIECSTCHGNVGAQTVAQRNVDLHMGFCVNCHREKDAPNECVTCHF